MSSYADKASKYYLSTGTRPPRRLIWAVALVKAAASRANAELGLIDPAKAKAIESAAVRVAGGEFDHLITVDVFQTGSGTGVNMNVNEVIAGLASQACGCPVHPNDDVNMAQSSNDVMPTALRLAALSGFVGSLAPALNDLIAALRVRAYEFRDQVRPGRTHLRDALPITLGLQLEAYAYMLERDLVAVGQVLEPLREVPLGGTAVGTGTNAHPRFAEVAIRELSSLSGVMLRPSPSKSAQMRSLSDIVILSGALRALVLDIMRISNDLRLMSSGPNTGLNEVEIPVEVAGSSMMPGKKNPVTLEAINQAAVQVLGIDKAIEWAASLGELELSMGIPLTAYDVLLEIDLLTEMARKLKTVIDIMRPNGERMAALAASSQALLTLVSPLIGYDAATKIAESLSRGASLDEAVRAAVSDEELARKVIDALTRVKGLVKDQ
ncbi:MAG: lyase family protein [Acidilobus sp.]